jgi:hypothetical protein
MKLSLFVLFFVFIEYIADFHQNFSIYLDIVLINFSVRRYSFKCLVFEVVHRVILPHTAPHIHNKYSDDSDHNVRQNNLQREKIMEIYSSSTFLLMHRASCILCDFHNRLTPLELSDCYLIRRKEFIAN